MKRRNVIAVFIFLLFYLGFGVYLTIFQERIVYHPNTQNFAACPALQATEHVNFNGTRMYAKDLHKPVAVLYHGNAGSACDRSWYATIFSDAGYGYLIVEYAGYSNDPRQPTHEFIKQDVQNVIAYLEKNNVRNVAVIGESIGTGVASYHTSLAPPEKVLLISPFTDLADIARQRFWFYPTRFVVNNAYDNVGNLSDYSGLITIIHGTKDAVIPYKLGAQLFATLNAEKQLVTIEGAGHNDIFAYPETLSAINFFLE